MTSQNIVFYNICNNGDIFVSRSFVKDIISKLPNNEYYYAHKNKKYLLKDLNLKEIELIEHLKVSSIPKLIDTWYASNNKKYYDGCTIQTLYSLFKDVYNDLSINIEDILSYLPEIDYLKYGLSDNEKRNKNTILICNNKPLSGQSSQGDMSWFVQNIASFFPEKIFFVTNDTDQEIKLPNVFYTKNILKENNLIEVSWLSTQCSSIIGRASGPYTYSLVKKNINDKIHFFEIAYKDEKTNNFEKLNFGLPELGYTNFTNLDASKSWEDVLEGIQLNSNNL
jgi:hypothetical protein